jgi:hypothetical protein
VFRGNLLGCFGERPVDKRNLERKSRSPGSDLAGLAGVGSLHPPRPFFLVVHLERRFESIRKLCTHIRRAALPWTAERSAVPARGPLVNGGGLKQGSDLFEDSVHAHGGIDGGIYFVVVRTGMHDQDLSACMGFFDHVGEVMAIVFGKGGT